MNSPAPEPDAALHLRAARQGLWILLALATSNAVLWFFLLNFPSDPGIYVITALSLAQVLAGAMTLARGVGSLRGAPRAPRVGVAAVILGPLAVIVTPMLWMLAVFTIGMMAHGAR